MTDSRSIFRLFIICGTIIFAAWLGISIITDQIETIIYLIVGATLLACALLGNKIWLLIPFMAALNISLPIPGKPSSLLIAQAIVLGFTVLLFLMRKLPFQFKFTELEFWVLLVTLCVFQTYVRNPVSISVFGGDSVGGKGYFLYVISLGISFLFSVLIVSASELRSILRLSIIGGFLNLAISVLGNFIPFLGYMTGQYHQSADEVNYENFGQAVDKGKANRIGYLVELGRNLALWVCSFISPIQALRRPLWAFLILAAMLSAMLAGYRNGIITVGLILVLGTAYRSGAGGFIASAFAGFFAIALLAVVNIIHPLPPNVQRSLTFLPGTWEQRYKDDAKGSSEWRFEVWREALLTDRWINNKWLGDGLGFSAKELASQMNAGDSRLTGISGFDAQRENILANGDYHSGPVSCIRVFGYIGLGIFLLAQIRLAVHAHRQIIRCRGSGWFPLALFTGIPLIYGPIFFVFIFGDFKQNAAAFLLAVGMVRLLENNLPLAPYVKKSRLPYILQTKSNPDQLREPAAIRPRI